MKSLILMAMITALYAGIANAAESKTRTGVVSFEGILVKVVVNSQDGWFQIGESKFNSPVKVTGSGRVMAAQTKVGIMTWSETLEASVFLDGGDGGNIEGFQEYPCKDIRITITRTRGDGTRHIVKNECAYLD